MIARARFTRHRDGWPRAAEARASRFALDLGFRSILLPRANGWTDIVGPLYVTGSTGNRTTVTDNGVLARTSSVSGAWSDHLQDSGYLDPRDGYAWIARGTLKSVLGSWGGIMARTQDNGTTSGWAWQRTNMDRLFVYHANTNYDTGLAFSTLVDSREHVFLGLWRKAASRLELWVDGRLVASVSGANIAPGYTAQSGQIKILSSRDSANTHGSVAFAAFARGNLSAGAAARISSSPELLMAPRNRRVALRVVGDTGAVNLAGNAAGQAGASADLGVQTTHDLAGAAAAQAGAAGTLIINGVLAEDGFAGAGDLPDPPWVRTALNGVGYLSRQDGKLRAIAAGNSALYVHQATPPSADYTVSLDVECGAADNLNGSAVGVAGRYLGTQYYAARYVGTVGEYVLEKFDLFGGGLSTLGTYAAGLAASATATLSLRMVADQIAVLVDGVAVIEVTDSAISGAGQAGILAYTTSTTAWYGDNFQAVLAAASGAADLAGTAAAQPAAAASLSLTVPIAGAGIAIATADGALSIGIPLAGAAAGQAGAPGTLTVSGNADLAGHAVVQSAAGGGLSLTVPLAASAVAAALAAAGLDLGVLLAGDAAAAAQGSGALSVGTNLAGGAAAQADATGTLTLNVSLAGAAIAAAASSAALTATGSSALAGDAIAAAQASGTLTQAVPLAGAALTIAAAGANLTRIVPLHGAAASASLATGGLDLAVRMRADALVQALASAALDVQAGAYLQGDAAASAQAGGTLTLRINLAADAIAHALASGALTGDGTLARTPGYVVARRPRAWRAHRAARTWRVTA